jgi:hypothetical protein
MSNERVRMNLILTPLPYGRGSDSSLRLRGEQGVKNCVCAMLTVLGGEKLVTTF